MESEFVMRPRQKWSKKVVLNSHFNIYQNNKKLKRHVVVKLRLDNSYLSYELWCSSLICDESKKKVKEASAIFGQIKPVMYHTSSNSYLWWVMRRHPNTWWGTKISEKGPWLYIVGQIRKEEMVEKRKKLELKRMLMQMVCSFYQSIIWSIPLLNSGDVSWSSH